VRSIQQSSSSEELKGRGERMGGRGREWAMESHQRTREAGRGIQESRSSQGERGKKRDGDIRGIAIISTELGFQGNQIGE